MRRQKVVVIEFLPRLFLQIWTRAILFFHPAHLSTLLYSAEIKSSAHLMLDTENICVEKNSYLTHIFEVYKVYYMPTLNLLNFHIRRAVHNVKELKKDFEPNWIHTTLPPHTSLSKCLLIREWNNEEAVNECEEE